MKTLIFAVMTFALLVIPSAFAGIPVQPNDCDFDGNGIDEIDLLKMVVLVPPAEYSVWGKPVYKVSPVNDCFVAVTSHGFVDSILRGLPADAASEATDLQIYTGPIRSRDVEVNETRILWRRPAPEGMIQDICITFTYVEQPLVTEEIENALTSPPTEIRDPNGGGISNPLDIAIVSKFLPLPEGVGSDYDLVVENVLAFMRANHGYINVDEYELSMLANKTSNGKLTISWGRIKQ